MSIGSTRADVEAKLQRIEARLEERRIAGHLEAGRHAQFGRGVRQVVVANATVALGKGAEDVVTQSRVQRQPAPESPVVLDETADVAGEVVAARVPLVEIRSAAGGAMPSEEEDPVVVVEVAVGAGHVLSGQTDVPVLGASLERVTGRHDRPAVSQAPHTLDVPEIPGVADAAGVALRVDVNRRHQRRQAANRVFERVVDAERGVEDVAILRDAGVLQIVVADVGLVQHAGAERVRVGETGEPGRRLPERRRRRRIGPAERLVDVLDRSGQR